MFEELPFKKVISLLNEYNIPYMVTGGLAVTVWGRIRSTLDIDIVLNIKKKDIENLVKVFQKDFYIDAEAVAIALSKELSFNVIDFESNTKIDFYLVGNNEQEEERFQRMIVKNIVGLIVAVISPEDLILIKLQWYKNSDSTRHLEDAESILKISQIDLEYIKERAKTQDTLETLEKILEKQIKND